MAKNNPHHSDVLPSPATETRRSLSPAIVTGGSFALDMPEDPRSLWGAGSTIVWAAGEPLLIVGHTGSGKSTLGIQVVLHRIGVLTGGLLGHQVQPTMKPFLYVAADRPRQIQANLHRMVGEEHRRRLDEMLYVSQGPLAFDIAQEPQALRALCRDAGVKGVLLDSLKDTAQGLSDDAVGSAVNRAVQACVADGIEVISTHHVRKSSTDGTGSSGVDGVYGSTWLTAGAGSVLHIITRKGVSTLSQLKAPVEPIAPIKYRTNESGVPIAELPEVTTAEILRDAHGPITVKDLAARKHGRNPSQAHQESVRRDLTRLATAGRVTVTPGTNGGNGGRKPALYRWAD